MGRSGELPRASLVCRWSSGHPEGTVHVQSCLALFAITFGGRRRTCVLENGEVLWAQSPQLKGPSKEAEEPAFCPWLKVRQGWGRGQGVSGSCLSSSPGFAFV